VRVLQNTEAENMRRGAFFIKECTQLLTINVRKGKIGNTACDYQNT